MRALVVAVLAVDLGCSHPPPPRAPVAEHPVRAFGDVAGEWAASDDLDFGYRLSVAASGDFTLATNRGKLGTCVLHAHTIVGTVAPTFELEVSLDECHRDRRPGMLQVAFPSFTDKELVLELTDAGEVTRRTFSAVASRPGS